MSAISYFRPRSKKAIMAGQTPAWMLRHPRGSYITQAILSFPGWVDREELKRIKRSADRMGMTIDHVVPLCHPRVCGLSVPWNLKLSPLGANVRKSNAWCQWHGELFPPGEQLSLWQ